MRRRIETGGNPPADAVRRNGVVVEGGQVVVTREEARNH